LLISQQFFDDLIFEVLSLRSNILDIYFSTSKDIRTKSDNSPVSSADLLINSHILKFLKKTKFPIISEECSIPFKDPITFWLIDPLDGTKDFISNSPEFCINIALIHNTSPILGIIYAPALDELYYNNPMGQTVSIIKSQKREYFKRKIDINHITLFTSHGDMITEHYLKEKFDCSVVNHVKLSSALKFGRLLTSDNGLYIRTIGSSIWDIAAGHSIIKNVGGDTISLLNNDSITYSISKIRNHPFFALPGQILKFK